MRIVEWCPNLNLQHIYSAMDFSTVCKFRKLLYFFSLILITATSSMKVHYCGPVCGSLTELFCIGAEQLHVVSRMVGGPAVVPAADPRLFETCSI